MKTWRNNYQSSPLYESTYWGCYGGAWSGIYYSGQINLKTVLWTDRWDVDGPFYAWYWDWQYAGSSTAYGTQQWDGYSWQSSAETNQYNARCTRGAADHYYNLVAGYIYLGTTSDGFGDANHPYDLPTYNP